MNEYIQNIQYSKQDNKISYKKTNKYKLGWKISPLKKCIQTNNIENCNNTIDNKKNNQIESYKSNDYFINNKCINNTISKYNIYKLYPEYFPEFVEQGDIESCVPTCISTIYYYTTFKQNNYANFRISRY